MVNVALSWPPKQRNILRFNVESNEPFGLSRISLDVKTAGAKPVVIHREFALQIQPPVPREQDARRLRIEPGATQKTRCEYGRTFLSWLGNFEREYVEPPTFKRAQYR